MCPPHAPVSSLCYEYNSLLGTHWLRFHNWNKCWPFSSLQCVPYRVVLTKGNFPLWCHWNPCFSFISWNDYNCPSFTSVSWGECGSFIPGAFSFLYSLSVNQIHNEGGRAVADALRVNHTLTSLTWVHRCLLLNFALSSCGTVVPADKLLCENYYRILMWS